MSSGSARSRSLWNRPPCCLLWYRRVGGHFLLDSRHLVRSWSRQKIDRRQEWLGVGDEGARWSVGTTTMAPQCCGSTCRQEGNGQRRLHQPRDRSARLAHHASQRRHCCRRFGGLDWARLGSAGLGLKRVTSNCSHEGMCVGGQKKKRERSNAQPELQEISVWGLPCGSSSRGRKARVLALSCPGPCKLLPTVRRRRSTPLSSSWVSGSRGR